MDTRVFWVSTDAMKEPNLSISTRLQSKAVVNALQAQQPQTHTGYMDLLKDALVMVLVERGVRRFIK